MDAQLEHPAKGLVVFKLIPRVYEMRPPGSQQTTDSSDLVNLVAWRVSSYCTIARKLAPPG